LGDGPVPERSGSGRAAHPRSTQGACQEEMSLNPEVGSFVSGHGFSRAANRGHSEGFSPCLLSNVTRACAPGLSTQGLNPRRCICSGRGRDAGCPAPPAQIRACATNAHGSYLGCLAANRSQAASRTPCSPWDTVAPLCVGSVRSFMWFSLIHRLPSSPSARLATFVRSSLRYYAMVRLPGGVQEERALVGSPSGPPLSRGDERHRDLLVPAH
jgi:hypothetical protein